METPFESFDVINNTTGEVILSNVSEHGADEYVLLYNSFTVGMPYEKRIHA